MKFLYVWFLVGFAWVASLQAVSTSLYEKGGGFTADERILYKKAFGKKEKVAEELHLEFFYPEGFAKTDSRPCIVFLGDRDKHLPVASAKRYDKTMKARGNVCKTCIYEGKGHGFFNLHKNGRDSFVVTMTETDQLLAGLGFLRGKPRVEAWLQAEEKK